MASAVGERSFGGRVEQDFEAFLLDRLSALYPDATSIALFGSRATGAALPHSNADILAFQDAKPSGGWGTEQFVLAGGTVKVDVLPGSMLRSPQVFSGTLDHEVFFSTVCEARILRDWDGRFASFSAQIREYPPFLRQNISLARIAKFCRAKKVIAKAIRNNDQDTYRSFVPHVIEHAGHALLARKGVYATRSWLTRLQAAEHQFYRCAVALYEITQLGPTIELELARLEELIAPHFEAACQPLLGCLATTDKTFKQIAKEFSFVDVYDLEILVQELRARNPLGQGNALQPA